ncbi:MAG: type II toxin-antitoxin system RelE/ParE family toxin [Planctomycetota bacterium]
MSYAVRIHPAAAQDFEEQFDYIAQRSLEGALRWEDAFEAMKARLAENPMIYGPALEEPWLRRGLRSAPFKTTQGNTYLAVYLVEDDEVTILRIRGHGQPPLQAEELAEP